MSILSRVFRSFFILFISVCSLMAPLVGVQAATNFLPNTFSYWKSYGSPKIQSDQVTLQGVDKEWVYVDIDVRSFNSGYFLLASYVDKIDQRTRYSSIDRNRSGNPYLYAYYLDAKGNIQKYLSGTSIRSTNRQGVDHVVYGVFPVMPGTKTIRIFLKQSSVRNISNKGVDVRFIQPILLHSATASDAQSLLRTYATATN